MKTRRHHNNKGLHQIRMGATRKQVERMAERLGVKYDERSECEIEDSAGRESKIE
jgi:hypothetical protein